MTIAEILHALQPAVALLGGLFLGLCLGLAIHECCHAIVCQYYGWSWTLMIAPAMEGSRWDSIKKGLWAAIRIDDPNYFREPSRRRRRVALAPLLAFIPTVVFFSVTDFQNPVVLMFLFGVIVSTFPSDKDLWQAYIWHERTRAWYQIKIGSRVKNHGLIEGQDCDRPW